jgi:hypothetical protein
MFVDKGENGRSDGRLELVEIQDEIPLERSGFKRTAGQERS